jgi:hypothetical protein
MAPIPLKSSQLQETIPQYSRRITREEDKDTITIDTPLQPSRTTNTSLDTPNTPTTRKRKIDYTNLHNFGFQGRPLPLPKPLAKRVRISNTGASQEASQATIIPEESENKEDNKDILEEKKQKQANASGKRTW